MADILQILAPADIGLDGDRLAALSLDVVYDVIERTLVAGREHEPCSPRAASNAVASPMPLEAPVMTIVWSCKGFRKTAMAVLSFFKQSHARRNAAGHATFQASGLSCVVQSGEELEPVAVRLREHRLDRVCCMIGNLLRDGGKQRVGLLRQAGLGQVVLGRGVGQPIMRGDHCRILRCLRCLRRRGRIRPHLREVERGVGLKVAAGLRPVARSR